MKIDIPSKYDPAQTEDKWYQYWLQNGFFTSKPDHREPYTIVIPPPNVTGVLHMGHMLNNTIQDVLVRKARMQGKNACWVPGTDHASIATEAKVVAKLAAEGINKRDLSREEFLTHAWDWTHKHGGVILEQLKKLGASCDWSRTRFTLDETLSESVLEVFVKLHKEGLIYRGVRMVNWDPSAKTALSDEEVIYKEVQSKLYYLKYFVEGESNYVVVATTRPETILGDTAVCVHPEDPRYIHLKGKKVLVPLINRPVPIIMDEYVDREFGTGVLKITPAHDVNDYMLGEKHGLETIDIFNDDGTLSEKATLYIGLDRFEVRRKIVEDLREKGMLDKIEDYVNKVGFSERTDAAIEPKLSMQWFLHMEELARPALDAILNKEVQLFPQKYTNVYRHWMENIRDWCISRQLWWGHRIPAWYLPGGGYVVAHNLAEALELGREQSGNLSLQAHDLRQDEDCLDTWFSSALWPISVFDGITNPENEDIRYYYPTNDLVTAPEILFFWVARMIISGYKWRGTYPFKNVYLHGIVRDKQGRKMSKSLGNSPDPIELMNQYGADGVRMGMLLSAPAGNDILFDIQLCEQGRNFNNKIWNAFRLIKGWTPDAQLPQPESSATAIRWFDALLSEQIIELNDLFEKYRLSEALMLVYKLFWDDFSSWYLEVIKPGYQQSIDAITYQKTLEHFEVLLKLLHPFMPFITEELWQWCSNRQEGESIMISEWPVSINSDKAILEQFATAKQIITDLRALRQEKGIPSREPIDMLVYGTVPLPDVLTKICVLSDLQSVSKKPSGTLSFMVGTLECFIPLSGKVNKVEELKKLHKELDYQQGFLRSVLKKLGNERFVQNAPETVLKNEQKKKTEAEIKIQALEAQIQTLM